MVGLIMTQLKPIAQFLKENKKQLPPEKFYQLVKEIMMLCNVELNDRPPELPEDIIA